MTDERVERVAALLFGFAVDRAWPHGISSPKPTWDTEGVPEAEREEMRAEARIVIAALDKEEGTG